MCMYVCVCNKREICLKKKVFFIFLHTIFSPIVHNISLEYFPCNMFQYVLQLKRSNQQRKVDDAYYFEKYFLHYKLYLKWF